MYAFPCFQFPDAFVKEAAEMGKPPDTLYCLRCADHLLERAMLQSNTCLLLIWSTLCDFPVRTSQ